MFNIFKTYSNKIILTSVKKNIVNATTESHLMEKQTQKTINMCPHPP